MTFHARPARCRRCGDEYIQRCPNHQLCEPCREVNRQEIQARADRARRDEARLAYLRRYYHAHKTLVSDRAELAPICAACEYHRMTGGCDGQCEMEPLP